jgi:RNA polymerase sigma-70 factor (ECF subfamily)
VNLTSESLLDRLKHARPDAADWHRLQDIYLPMIRSWLARVPGAGDEADDLAQEVLVVVIRELPRFERRRDGSFRAWLRQITVNRVRAFWKLRQRQPRAGMGEEADRLLAQLADSDSDLARQWDQEHDRHVFQKLLALVQRDFEPSSWDAFVRFALEGQPAAQVARELGLSENAVVLAKFRILKRLRAEAAGLTD